MVGGLAGDLVVGVVDGLLNEPEQMAVMQRVDDMPAVLASVHEPTEPEFSQVLADHRPGNKRFAYEFSDRLRALGELPEKVQAGRLGQHPQRPGGALKQLRPGIDRME